MVRIEVTAFKSGIVFSYPPVRTKCPDCRIGAITPGFRCEPRQQNPGDEAAEDENRKEEKERRRERPLCDLGDALALFRVCIAGKIPPEKIHRKSDAFIKEERTESRDNADYRKRQE